LSPLQGLTRDAPVRLLTPDNSFEVLAPLAYKFLRSSPIPGVSTVRVMVRLQGFSPSWRFAPPKAWRIYFTPPALMGFTLQSVLLPSSSTPFGVLSSMLLGTTPVFGPYKTDLNRGSLQLRSFYPLGSTCLTMGITPRSGGCSLEFFPLKFSPVSPWCLLPGASPLVLLSQVDKNLAPGTPGFYFAKRLACPGRTLGLPTSLRFLTFSLLTPLWVQPVLDCSSGTSKGYLPDTLL